MFIEDFFERKGVFERNRKAAPFISALKGEQKKRYGRRKIVPVPFWEWLIEIGAIQASDMPKRQEQIYPACPMEFFWLLFHRGKIFTP